MAPGLLLLGHLLHDLLITHIPLVGRLPTALGETCAGAPEDA